MVGSLHPSASGSRSKCRGAPFFAPFSRVFSKRTKRTVLYVSLAFSKVFNSTAGGRCARCHAALLRSLACFSLITTTKFPREAIFLLAKAPPIENWLSSVGCRLRQTRPWLGLVDLSRIPSGTFFFFFGRSILARKWPAEMTKTRQNENENFQSMANRENS